MFEKHHQPLSPQAPRSVQNQQNTRRAVWRVVVDSGDPQGCADRGFGLAASASATASQLKYSASSRAYEVS
ncbi:hypothetical protein [Nonomuraea guangzhouensis]|uniref:DUF397 domain-containing protein n=1 Tax=Nonomuraea guangzhouensis TaxID=1291555 RepID=A0ABW4GWU6_9ACTN|nr:hypothetical protein [Nonomuraea guangzhouensis]